MRRLVTLILLLCAFTTAHAERMFSSSSNLVGLPSIWNDCRLADFNHDSKDDLLVPFYPGLGLALSTGGGSFAPFTTAFPSVSAFGCSSRNSSQAA